MDTGAGRDTVDPFEPSLLPTEDTGHKKRLLSQIDQFDTTRSVDEVLAKDRNLVSNKRVKPLGVNKNAQNRQTSLSFAQTNSVDLNNVDQTATPRQEWRLETMVRAPQKANQMEETKVKAPQKANQMGETKVKAPQKANQKKQSKVKAREKADHKEQSNAKASQRAGEKKQSVLDGFQAFSRKPRFLPRSDKGSKSCNDGWESDWDSDVDKRDDTSHMFNSDNELISDDKVICEPEAHMAIGDEKVVPGPEGEDFSVGDSPDQTNIQSSAKETPYLNGNLFKTIREILLFLKKWAGETSFMELQDRPITLGFWTLLSRVSIDFLMGLLAPAISLEVQALFEADTFSVEDLRHLPKAGFKKRPGIYLGFIIEAEHDDGTVTLTLYVGSSICVRDAHKGSQFYRRLKKGAKVEFRVLAAFNSSIERGYLNLLEAIFIFLFGTLRKPTYESEFIKQSTWKLYEMLQGATGYRPHFEGQIVGLNAA
ncbi:hypothetical protein N7519_005374 [Penicillium mononematosum]|uniref:uncharacterized protein n=1 Tax=Penicillium mononematosum TaxID=268346 RepID=UPI0025478341|nr:uncharacterized protein N7519_005374 [Penicillium mononematosum]KAJ6184073.1 hypothetical protein N7519_005374 [Penicillium mononematosum]